MSDLGFSYLIKNREVSILRNGKKVTVLRADRAAAFCDEVVDMDDHSAQQLMARVTGNYKRGNEKLAKSNQSSKYQN
ncbi:MAG: hypothetical protein JKY55_13755 [Aliivibrio sp.]|nr:hypothetical protein [Aliivibrio sp.]